MTIEEDLTAALADTPQMVRDGATVSLSLSLARQLDDLFRKIEFVDTAEDYRDHRRLIMSITNIGVLYRATLESLGMSPGSRPARPAGGEGAGGDPSSGALAALRTDAERGYPASGIDYAEAVDPAVTEADAED